MWVELIKPVASDPNKLEQETPQVRPLHKIETGHCRMHKLALVNTKKKRAKESDGGACIVAVDHRTPTRSSILSDIDAINAVIDLHRQMSIYIPGKFQVQQTHPIS